MKNGKNECPVCMMDSYMLNILSCSHKFCDLCLTTFEKSNMKNCPICRSKYETKNISLTRAAEILTNCDFKDIDELYDKIQQFRDFNRKKFLKELYKCMAIKNFSIHPENIERYLKFLKYENNDLHKTALTISYLYSDSNMHLWYDYDNYSNVCSLLNNFDKLLIDIGINNKLEKKRKLLSNISGYQPNLFKLQQVHPQCTKLYVQDNEENTIYTMNLIQYYFLVNTNPIILTGRCSKHFLIKIIQAKLSLKHCLDKKIKNAIDEILNLKYDEAIINAELEKIKKDNIQQLKLEPDKIYNLCMDVGQFIKWNKGRTKEEVVEYIESRCYFVENQEIIDRLLSHHHIFIQDNLFKHTGVY